MTKLVLKMDESQKKFFFEIDIDARHGRDRCAFAIEELYQAFKQRLAAEAALNVWPEGQ